VTVPWNALVRPFWESSDPLDLTQVDRLLLRETSTGAFDVFVDNVALTGGAGGSTLLLDDFDDGDLQNALGSYWWADGGANCASCSPSTASLTNEAAAGHGSVAHFTVHQEPDGWNNAGTGIPGIDASSYVAVRLDLRATGVVEIRGELADAPYLNNASCPLDANFVVSDACGIDQGRLVPPYTDGFAGAAPDLGAFESGRPRWTAGSTVDDVPVWSACESRLP
jgi:hypothetical protein